jgi:serine/threonine-protein kinase
MAEVYAAEDLELGRPVAVKLLAEPLAADASFRRRFQREARAAARLTGEPNVVAVYDVGEWRGRPYLVMELVPGGTVADALRAGPVERERALGWLEDAARALDAAHARGVVHRDVKPGNLLIDAQGRARIADFGIARVLDDALTQTAPGTVLGTAGYLAPEQARGERASPASDRYALGVVARELLTGRRPGSAAEGPGADTAPLLPPLPPAAGAVLARATAPDPADRPASAQELVAELRGALAEDSPTAQAPPAPAARRRGPVAAAVAGALAAVGLGLGLALALSGGGASQPATTAHRTAAEPATTAAPAVTAPAAVTVTTSRTVTAPAAPVPPAPSPARGEKPGKGHGKGHARGRGHAKHPGGDGGD